MTVNTPGSDPASAAMMASMKKMRTDIDAIPLVPAHGIANAPVNAPTNAPTNYGVIAAVLGAEVNANNTKQNSTAQNCNDIGIIVNQMLLFMTILKDRLDAVLVASE